MADAPKLLGTDTLRQAYPKFNQAIDNANEALGTANTAKSTADTAKSTADTALANSENTQTQLDTIVINGDSSVEAAQARVAADGSTFTTLKERLDNRDEQLAERPTQEELKTETLQYKMPKYRFFPKRIKDKILAGQTVTYTILGDSISQSDGATSFEMKWNIRWETEVKAKYPQAVFNFTGVGVGTQSGSIITGCLHRLTKYDFNNIDLVFICCGANDDGKVDKLSFAQQYESVIRALLPKVDIIMVLENPPKEVQKWKHADTQIQLANHYRLGLMDCYDAFLNSATPIDQLIGDSIHPNDTGYTLFVEELMDLTEYGALNYPSYSEPLFPGTNNNPVARAFSETELSPANQNLIITEFGKGFTIKVRGQSNGGDMNIYINDVLQKQVNTYDYYGFDLYYFIPAPLGKNTLKLENVSGANFIKEINTVTPVTSTLNREFFTSTGDVTDESTYRIIRAGSVSTVIFTAHTEMKAYFILITAYGDPNIEIVVNAVNKFTGKLSAGSDFVFDIKKGTNIIELKNVDATLPGILLNFNLALSGYKSPVSIKKAPEYNPSFKETPIFSYKELESGYLVELPS
jgi:lysophospholipase L1-like esterase